MRVVLAFDVPEDRDPGLRLRVQAPAIQQLTFQRRAIVLDVYSRRIVGWSMATHMHTSLVLEALNMALAQRRPHAVIHDSDRGSQYTALAFGQGCEVMRGPPLPRGAVGSAYDNATAESFLAEVEEAGPRSGCT
jgi:transposase InsO family protein